MTHGCKLRLIAVFVPASIIVAAAALGGCHAGAGSTDAGENSPYSTQSQSARNPLEAQRLTLSAADLLDRADATADAAYVDPAKPGFAKLGSETVKLAKEQAALLDQAAKLLREALTADLYHGPAHNDLGIVYLKQGKLYEAASEFEWARKLMPGHPDPRMNLALTLERAGRYDDAIRAYASALEVYPGHIPTLEALTRLQLRHGKSDDHTPDALHTIALEGDSPQWRSWAQEQISRLK